MTRLFRKLGTGIALSALALILLSLSACGQKGDLYLPDRSARYSSSPDL